MADIRIVIGGRDLRDLSPQAKRDVYTAFVEAYYTELRHDVETKPQKYAWSDKSSEEVARVVARMCQALYHERANNSNALKRAAKRLGLNGAMKYTAALVQQSFVSDEELASCKV